MLIPVNFNLGGKSYTPYWRVCIGGGPVGEALRADFQRHLELVQPAAKPHEIYDLFAVQPPREFQLKVDGVGEGVRLQITRFNHQHGSVYDDGAAMGTQQHILQADLEVLRRQMELDVAIERIATPDGSLEWATTIQPFGVTLVEIGPVDG